MSVFIMEPKALNYVKYLNAFCSDEAETEAERSDALEFIEKTDREKDGVICDLLKTALDRCLMGAEFETVFSALEREFELCGLNEKLSFSDMSWFFDFYIRERQTELKNYSEGGLDLLNNFYEQMKLLPDSTYKVNVYLFFLQSVLDLQAVGRMSVKVDEVLEYLSNYDLTDEELQKELGRIFQLTMYVTPATDAGVGA